MAFEAFANPAGANRALDSARSDAAAARDSAGAAAVANIRLREQNQKLEADLLDAKKALHGQVAIRDALKAALAEIAPDHTLVVDVESRKSIREEAESKVTPDSPWWP